MIIPILLSIPLIIVAFFGIRDLAQVGGAAENLYSPREITHVAPENAILAEKSRMVGAPDGGGPVGRLARGSPNRSFAERVLKLFSTPCGHPRSCGCLTGVPRRISLGFAHSAAAAGFCRRHNVRSVDLKQNVWSDGRREVVRSVDLKKTICVDQSGLATIPGNWK